MPNEDLIIERIASIAVPPNDPLQQFMEEHENDMFMQEREEIDEILLKEFITMLRIGRSTKVKNQV